MLIDSKDGKISVDFDEMTSCQHREMSSGNLVNHEVHFTPKANSMYIVFNVASKDKAHEIVEKFDKYKEASKASEAKIKDTYLDGFKEGCEYTLKLK